MVGLEAIVQRYKEKLDEAVAVVETGERYLFDSHTLYTEWVVKDTDFRDRFNAAFSLLYDVVKKAKTENESLLPTIAERARTPVIDDVLNFIGETDNFGEAKDQFVEKLSQKYMPKGPHGMGMTLLFPLRTALFLEAIRRHPEKAKIATITTSYFPHKLFGDLNVERSQWYIVKEAETEIATVLPTIYSERLQSVIPKINEFVERGSYGGSRG
ncbi:hypothetical protein HYX12_04085, partial [Candidatus Woesearchaeota archaeon]|nr:hypothetical protein [Candidatus Woesearchaeota archaeon]